MKLSTISALVTSSLLATVGYAQSQSSSVDDLEGTWSSKSGAVITGPDFYDPIDELLLEPTLPGISYSFTKDGFFEEAIYQISANPRDPKCPTGVLIFQHGTYNISDNGTLTLEPYKVDGRQLLSDPCKQEENAVYSRYNQTEKFKQFAVYVDPYHGRYRLDLFQFNGAPMPPMYLAYRPAMMLPTETLNPTQEAASQPENTGSTRAKIRRSIDNRKVTGIKKHSVVDYNSLWWFGVSMIAAGGAGWYFL